MALKYARVRFDESAESFVDEQGNDVVFSKIMHVRIDGEVTDTRLAFTRKRNGLTSHPLPCIFFDGERMHLDDERVEIATACIARALR